jgi:OmpA-OmpF porin, OOP family
MIILNIKKLFDKIKSTFHSIYPMVFYFHFLLLLIISFDLDGQRKMAKTYYKNKHLKSAGFIYKYPIFYDVKMPPKMQKFGEIEKKGKIWKYWYQNGQICRIESYKFVRDKNPYDLPNGKWIYFNEQGKKYREDTYLNGNLSNFTKEIYKDYHLTGEITLNKGILDTTLFEPFTIENNLIMNPSFDYFFYKPVSVIYDGKSKIDDWTPFWITPGNYTPDYLSNLRTIDVLSNYFLFDFPLPDKYSYVGLGLFREKTNYSEYIQGKLIKPLLKGRRYCVKISLALSSYSGFSINRIACHLSANQVNINENNESSFSTQIVLSTLSVDNKQFITLCDCFIAEGGEQFISIGRFTSSKNLKIKQRENIPLSQFGIEESAYYLIDNVDLHEIQDPIDCFCKNSFIQNEKIQTLPDSVIPTIETDLRNLKLGDSLILKNVNFEFNSSTIQLEADKILKILFNYLQEHPKIRILICGYTDDQGSREYNLELSVNRAKTVYTWLVNQGIEANRLKYIGFGKSYPLYNDKSGKFNEFNRRVEIKITYYEN